MTRISSKSTVLQKKVVPVVWFGFVAIVSTAVIAAGGAAVVVALPLCAVAAAGYLVFKNRIFDLVDEVSDCGDFLLVRDGDIEERVPLSNIREVKASVQINPQRIELRLIQPGKLGASIAFIPVSPIFYNPFAPNKIASDLIARVNRLRG